MTKERMNEKVGKSLPLMIKIVYFIDWFYGCNLYGTLLVYHAVFD